MTEDELSNSLASWVPPWQRATTPAATPETDKDHQTPSVGDDRAHGEQEQRPAADEVAEPIEDEDTEQRPETDVLAGPPDDEDDDEQRPETDVHAGFDDAGLRVAPDDEDDDEQRPETDVHAEFDDAGQRVAPDDEDDDEQRPETDVYAERGGEQPSDDDEDDEEQRPETDVTGAGDWPHAAGADSGLSTIIGGDHDDDFEYQESQHAAISRDDLAARPVPAEEAAVRRPAFAAEAAAALSGSIGRGASLGRDGSVGRDGSIGDGSAGEDSPGEAEQRSTAEIPVDRPANLGAALEAILLVVDEPVSDDVLAEIVDVPVAEVTEALVALAAGYAEQGRGFDLRRAAGGWRFYTRGEYSSYVERFVLDGQSVRLTQAALETLAVIAYQQPVTRSRMAAIRGVSCDGVVRTLTTRGLIEECGTQPDSGAFLYRTTPLFLEKLGLDSLDELPPLAPFLPDDVNGFADV